MSALIDFTPQLAESYSRQIEAPGPTEAEIDWKAVQILRGISPLDASDALYDVIPRLVKATLDYRNAHSNDERIMTETLLGIIVRQALWNHCHSIAERELA